MYWVLRQINQNSVYSKWVRYVSHMYKWHNKNVWLTSYIIYYRCFIINKKVDLQVSFLCEQKKPSPWTNMPQLYYPLFTMYIFLLHHPSTYSNKPSASLFEVAVLASQLSLWCFVLTHLLCRTELSISLQNTNMITSW